MRRRLRLARTLAGLGALVLLVVWLAGGSGVAGPAQPTVRVTLPPVAIVGGPAGSEASGSTSAGSEVSGSTSAGASTRSPSYPWPSTGEAAVAVPEVGYRAHSGAERPVPVASMTKIMTAYVVLGDHPLALGQQGPRVRITSADASQFGVDTATNQSNVAVKAGEVLTERQMLEGLLVHSANDLAYALAVWDAGGIGAFVTKMNRTATRLGMRHTHFADASGYSPSSRSTAADLLRVAAAAMSDPVFSQIVSMTSVALPVAGTVQSYTPLIGTTGVIGVKSGFTTAAGGGDVLAYRTSVGGHAFLALAAVTSQRTWTVLGVAGKDALALAKVAATRVETVTIAKRGTVVAQVRAGGRTIPLSTSAAASLLALSGSRVRQVVHLRVPRPGTRKGTQLGAAVFVLAGERVTVPVRAAARIL